MHRLRFLLPCLLSITGLCRAADSGIGLELLPGQALLNRSMTQRLILEAVDERGYIGPVKSEIRWNSADPSIAKVDGGVVIPVSAGSVQVQAETTVDGTPVVATATITVADGDGDTGWDFSRHVLPVLSKAGCNSGACHGALAGKGGFKLSLRGYNPEADYNAIARHARGRRIELADPGRSLLIAKPSTALPHKGGLRLPRDSDDYQLVVDWISSGIKPPSSEDAQLVSLEVLPNMATLSIGDRQPLIVVASYSDGRQEDVTRWTRFSATNQSVASVGDDGTVTIMGHGEGAIVAWFSSQIKLFRVTVPFPNDLDEEDLKQLPRRNFIDDLVLDQLARLKLKPSPRSSDNEFVRRIYLDVIGTLPTIKETQSFLADERPDKRDRLIESLLSRSEFVDFWSYKWSDVLLVNGRRLRPEAVKAYSAWLRDHVASNTPWDEVVRQVVTATGSTLANGATNFYSLHQSPEEMTENVCQAFLSLSIGCAKCHNHPLEKWTNDQYYAMASHFSRVRAKGWGGDGRSGDGARTVFLASSGELMQPTTGKPQPPTPLDGQPLAFDAPGDRRDHLANWLTAPDNPYFAKAIANRVWANLFGIGLVNPIDDLRVSNPASNQPLLDALAQHVIDHDFDLKACMRTMLQSETYQRTSQPLPENEVDQQFFSRYLPRRLTAEVLLDAIAQVSEVPTEFTQIGFDGADFQNTTDYPLGTRAIQLADSAVVSNFLKTFGRNERDITCECERSNTPSIVQVLHINNGVTINDRLASEGSCVAKAMEEQVDAEQVVNEAFMKALCRLPTQAESAPLTSLLSEASESDRRDVVEDLYWSVLSSREFLFNH